MNKKFLAGVLTMILAGSVFTGCTASKEDKNTLVVESTDSVQEVVEEVVDSADNTQVVEENSESVEEATTEETTDEVSEENMELPVEESVEDIVVDETINSDDYAGIDPSVAQETVFVITDGIELPLRTNMDVAKFQESYGIDPNALSSYVVSMPADDTHATEIAVFELKDAASAKSVKAGIEKRVQALIKLWEKKSTAQHTLVKNYQVVEKGNFVLFVISDRADAIISKFKAFV